MKRTAIFLTIFSLALCSMAYELILAQTLTVFLHNTVLRYSVTIGLYLFALGFGSLMAEDRWMKSPLVRLQQIEVLLSIVGGFCVIFLFLFERGFGSGLVFNIIAHGFILIIGFLSGWELPLLIKLSANQGNQSSENLVLAINYAGAFMGTLIFAFIFYPRLGLILSALTVGFLNAFVGVCLSVIYHKEKSDQYLWLIQSVVFVLLLYYIWQSDGVTQYFINQYIQK